MYIVTELFVIVKYWTEYVEDLMGFIMGPVFEDPAAYREEILKIHIPPDLSSEFEHPEKEEVIASYVSRFNRGEAVWNPHIVLGYQETLDEHAGPHTTGWRPLFCVQGIPNTNSQSFCRQDNCND